MTSIFAARKRLALALSVAAVTILFVSYERKFYLMEDALHVLRERTSLFCSLNRTSSLCNITFELEGCSCQRSIRAHLPVSCPGFFSTPRGILAGIKRMYGESTCGDWATFRGPHQKVVSYSVFGDFPNDYYLGMELLIPRIAEVYPDWVIRFYHRMDLHNATVRNWLCDLSCIYPQLDLCHVENLPVFGNITYAFGRVWRFAPMGDALVDRYMVRDADSPILQREVDAVEDWIKDGTCFHAMRDYPRHGARMLAGMWGGCNDWRAADILNATRRIFGSAFYTQTDVFADQREMLRKLWPIAGRNITVHASYFCKNFGYSEPFPTRRDNFTYVGEKSFIAGYVMEPFAECPEECRPSNHMDWLHC
ncbi:uncharacterized protein [Macrobrachium rosenbergii]|uniref:uncharacterized protein n=1 Tax=Macrobrachium rosenbergii TaxID=79674 RepID=UPI0034D523B0